jgi:iron(III) transport system permease protein
VSVPAAGVEATGRRSRRPPVFLAAASVAALAVVCLPLAYLVIRAAGGGAAAWETLTRPRTVSLVGETAALVAATTAAAVLVAVPLAWLVTRTDLPGRRVWVIAAALPLVIPSYVAALALLAAFGPRGLVQQLLEGPFGVERVPEVYGLGGGVLALTISTYPYVFLLTAVALRDVDPALEETARGLGRGRVATFLHVTLPLVRPSIGAGALLAALYALSDFGAVSLMQTDSLTRAIYVQYRSLFDRTPAAVLALVLVALTAVLLILELRLRGRGRLARAGPGTARPAPPARLGRARWPALAFCAAVVALSLAAPLAVLGYWFSRAASASELAEAAAAAGRSLLASGLAAALTVLAALPLALLVARHPTRWTNALERVGYGANALPGIVIALSLVFFAANYASPVYQTLALLLVAYGVRFYPQALAASHASLAAVSPRLEEAARALGRGPVATFASVTAPLAAPGLLAGGALVFLSAMKELPATLLLRPIGYETLATEIWTATTVGAYSRAAVPALFLVALSAPVVYLLLRRPDRALDAPG